MPTPKKSTVQRITSITRLPTRRDPLSAAAPAPSGWDLAAKTALATGAFLIPLAVGSWTPDRWEINKTVVLLATVTVAWCCYFVGQLRRPTGAWRWHPLDWLVLMLGLAALIGTVTSVTWWTSVAGIQGAYAETLPVTLGFISVYFLSARLCRTSAERLIIWSALLSGVGLSLFLQLFQFAGVALLPGALGQDKLFSTMDNSSLQVALLAAVLGAMGLFLWPKARENWARLGLVAVITLGWLILLFLGQPIAWAVFALGMILVVLSQAGRTSAPSSRLVMAAVVLAASGLLSQFLKLNTYTSLPASTAITLRQSTSAATALATVTKRPVLGTGPNTWFDAFVQHRPLSYNADPRWSNRYLRAGAEWSQLLATQGVAGFGLWVGLIVVAGAEFWRRLRRGSSFTLLTGLYAVAILALSAVLATWSLTLLTLVWFALGLGRAKIAAADQTAAAVRTPWPALGFAVTVILAIVIWFPAIRLYASQVSLARAQQQINQRAAVSSIIGTLQTAVRLDGHNVDAGILLANAQAVRIQDDLQANNVAAAQQDLNAATTTIRSVVTRNPNNPAVYEAENNILNSLASYLPNPEQQANDNFIVLRRLEPTNPIHDVGYGQTLLVVRARAAANRTVTPTADRLADYQRRATQAFDQALQKKPDYLQARFARGEANLLDGQYQAALDDLETLTATSPTVAVFWAAKGTALAKLEKNDQAKASFEQALQLDDRDPNTYLAYSQALSDAKKTDEAKAVLDRGLKALPGNQDLDAALKKLSA